MNLTKISDLLYTFYFFIETLKIYCRNHTYTIRYVNRHWVSKYKSLTITISSKYDRSRPSMVISTSTQWCDERQVNKERGWESEKEEERRVLPVLANSRHAWPKKGVKVVWSVWWCGFCVPSIYEENAFPPSKDKKGSLNNSPANMLHYIFKNGGKYYVYLTMISLLISALKSSPQSNKFIHKLFLSFYTLFHNLLIFRFLIWWFTIFTCFRLQLLYFLGLYTD